MNRSAPRLTDLPLAALGVALTGCLTGGLTGCLPSQQAPAQADLRATDTGSRVPAIVRAAEGEDVETARELMRALMDDDPAVRLFAIQSLHTRYGQTLGYRYYDQEAQRSLAVARWRAWLADHIDPALAEPDADAAKPDAPGPDNPQSDTADATAQSPSPQHEPSTDGPPDP